MSLADRIVFSPVNRIPINSELSHQFLRFGSTQLRPIQLKNSSSDCHTGGSVGFGMLQLHFFFFFSASVYFHVHSVSMRRPSSVPTHPFVLQPAAITWKEKSRLPVL